MAWPPVSDQIVQENEFHIDINSNRGFRNGGLQTGKSSSIPLEQLLAQEATSGSRAEHKLAHRRTVLSKNPVKDCFKRTFSTWHGLCLYLSVQGTPKDIHSLKRHGADYANSLLYLDRRKNPG